MKSKLAPYFIFGSLPYLMLSFYLLDLFLRLVSAGDDVLFFIGITLISLQIGVNIFLINFLISKLKPQTPKP